MGCRRRYLKSLLCQKGFNSREGKNRLVYRVAAQPKIKSCALLSKSELHWQVSTALASLLGRSCLHPWIKDLSVNTDMELDRFLSTFVVAWMAERRAWNVSKLAPARAGLTLANAGAIRFVSNFILVILGLDRNLFRDCGSR